MATHILKGKEAREKILKGVDEIADTAKVTLGPGGRNVFIKKIGQSDLITKDGVTVCESIYPQGQLEAMGADLVKQASRQAWKHAGDGTTTAAILCQAIARAGMDEVEIGRNPTEMKIGMLQAVKDVVAEIKKVSEPIGDDIEKIRHVATISGNNNPEIGDLMADAVKKVTIDGSIVIDNGKGYETTVDTFEGYAFDYGDLQPTSMQFRSKFFGKKTEPLIFVSDYILRGEVSKTGLFNVLLLGKQKFVEDQIKDGNTKMPQWDEMINNPAKHAKDLELLPGHPIVLIVSDIDDAHMRQIVTIADNPMTPVTLLIAPAWGDLRKEMLKDIASITGATFVSEDAGTTLQNVTLDMLGTCDSMVVDKKLCIMYGANGDVTERLNEMESEFALIPEENHSALRERIGRLKGGLAIINVGAKTEVEMNEKKARVDDAVRATRAAIEEGVVVGGGITFANIHEKLNTITASYKDFEFGLVIDEAAWNEEDLNSRIEVITTKEIAFDGERLGGVTDSDIDKGYDIIIASLLSPIRQIILNTGQDPDNIMKQIAMNQILPDKGNTWGYNAKSDKIEDLKVAGILEPAKVLRVALENAYSVASTLMSTECAIFQHIEFK